MLRLTGVERTYGQGETSLSILRKADFQLKSGEMVALVAPSGTGKSTLLHLAGLLEHPDAGEVYINDAPCNGLPDETRTAIRRSDIGFVYQFHHLLPEFSAVENVMMPQLIAGLSQAEARKRASALLDYMRVGHRGEHRPAELSGVNSSASPLPAPSPMHRSCCWRTSRLAISIRRPPLMSSTHWRRWFASPASQR